MASAGLALGEPQHPAAGRGGVVQELHGCERRVGTARSNTPRTGDAPVRVLPCPDLESRVLASRGQQHGDRTAPDDHARAGGLDATQYGEGGRRRVRCQRGEASRAAGLLVRQVRGHESRIQTVRRRRWLPRSKVLEGTLPAWRSRARLRRVHRAFPRSHRQARPGIMGAWQLPGRAGRLSGCRHQLVRGGRVCRVRGKEPAHALSLVSSGQHGRDLVGHPPPQQLRGQRSASSWRERRPWSVGNARHGRQRQGMVHQPDGGNHAPLHSRRQLG